MHEADHIDDEIRVLVRSLSRPHASGGSVIERAAIMAAGADSAAILTWIAAHDAQPEELPVATVSGGLHGARAGSGGASAPRRYVLPAGALGAG